MCKSECDQDIYCNGYSTDSSENLCFLSQCNINIKVPGCSTCSFWSKKNPSSSVLCFPDTTTIDMTTKTALTTSTFTDKVTHTIDTNNTFCTCVCKFVNQTLQESIDNRRKDLILNKTKLASSIRKLSSAQDFRMSSEVIGVVAIIVLVMFGVLCFCVDVGFMMSLVLSIKSNKNQLKWYRYMNLCYIFFHRILSLLNEFVSTAVTFWKSMSMLNKKAKTFPLFSWSFYIWLHIYLFVLLRTMCIVCWLSLTYTK